MAISSIFCSPACLFFLSRKCFRNEKSWLTRKKKEKKKKAAWLLFFFSLLLLSRLTSEAGEVRKRPQDKSFWQILSWSGDLGNKRRRGLAIRPLLSLVTPVSSSLTEKVTKIALCYWEFLETYGRQWLFLILFEWQGGENQKTGDEENKKVVTKRETWWRAFKNKKRDIYLTVSATKIWDQKYLESERIAYFAISY